MNEVEIGDEVEFEGADSYYKGIVVALFNKLDSTTGTLTGALRCIVQDHNGLLLIKNPTSALITKKYND